MEPGKPRKFRIKVRQRLSYRLILVTGISVAMICAVLIIYFQFIRNEETKADSLQALTNNKMPVEMVVAEKILVNADTLSHNGNRYKIAKPLSQINPTR